MKTQPSGKWTKLSPEEIKDILKPEGEYIPTLKRIRGEHQIELLEIAVENPGFEFVEKFRKIKDRNEFGVQLDRFNKKLESAYSKDETPYLIQLLGKGLKIKEYYFMKLEEDKKEQEHEKEKAVPFDIPQSAPHFQNREEETEHAVEILTRKKPFVIYGMGGMGKSELAIRIAHALAEKTNFEGFYWCQLTEDATIEQVVERIVRTVRISRINNLPIDSQLRMLARELSERNILVVLDNVLDAETIRTLLRYFQESAFLLTTRIRISDTEVESNEQLLDLSELPPDVATELLLLHSGESRAESPLEITEICRMVGGHPLAIRILASGKFNDKLSFEELRNELDEYLKEEEYSNESLIEAIFEGPYKRLGEKEEDARRCLRVVSVFPGGFLLDAVKELMDCPLSPAARRLLREPLQGSLIQRDQSGRYHLHDIVRRLAFNKLDEEGETRQIVQKAAKYLASLCEEKPEDLAQDLDNLTSIATQLHELKAYEDVISLTDASMVPLEKQHQLPDLNIVIDVGLKAAKGLSLSDREARYLFCISRSLGRMGKNPESIEAGEQALTLAEQGDDFSLQAHILFHLGYIYRNNGQTDRALSLLSKSEDLSDKINDIASKARCYLAQGLIKEGQGEINAGRELYLKALALCESPEIKEIMDERFLDIPRLLGDLEFNQGNDDLARESWQKIVDYSYQIKSKHWEIVGKARLSLVDPDASLEVQKDYWRENLNANLNSGEGPSALTSYGELAEICIKLKENEEAIGLCGKAEEIAAELKTLHAQAAIAYVRGVRKVAEGDIEAARQQLQDAQDLFQKFTSPHRYWISNTFKRLRID